MAVLMRSGGAWMLLFLILLVVLRFVLDREPAPKNRPLPEEGWHRVERVVDGDTLVLATGHRVRLLGVDTPETVKPNHPAEPWGAEASGFTKSLAEGKRVRLEYDLDLWDRYDRLLAWVFLEDGRMLNEELVRAGLSPAYTKYRFSAVYRKRLVSAEADAKSRRLGIWSDMQ